MWLKIGKPWKILSFKKSGLRVLGLGVGGGGEFVAAVTVNGYRWKSQNKCQIFSKRGNFPRRDLMLMKHGL